MSEQNKTQNVFSKFMGQFIRCEYEDFGKLKIAKGDLVGFDNDFIHLKGDYSEQIIAICKVTKISKAVRGEE